MCMIMVILFMCKSMYYILLLSQMSKLQFCSESNYAAIFQLNSLPGKIIFLSFRLGFFFFFFFGNWEKRSIFWIGKAAYIGPLAYIRLLVIGRKGPGFALYIKSIITLILNGYFRSAKKYS